MKLIFPLTFLTTLLVAPVSAWVTPTTTTTTTTTTSLAAMSRRQALWQGLSTSSAAAAILLTAPSIATAEESTTLPNGVSYTVTKSAGPNAIKPALGDLVAIRFAAYSGDIKIDDIFDTPEPYYTRVGSGGLVKGVEQVLPLMSVGDRWVLTIPVSNSIMKKWRGRLRGVWINGVGICLILFLTLAV